jgi:hypothetical protein
MPIDAGGRAVRRRDGDDIELGGQEVDRTGFGTKRQAARQANNVRLITSTLHPVAEAPCGAPGMMRFKDIT